MSAVPEPQDVQVIEQERRRLGKRLEEMARLCEANVSPPVFHGEMMKKLMESLMPLAGALWTRTAQGNLQLQFQVNFKETGFDQNEEARKSHEELVRFVVGQPKPMHLPPNSGVGTGDDGKPAAGNLTPHQLLLMPIMLGNQVGGLIEIWQSADRPANAVQGFLQYMSLMADLAARYQRNQMIGQMTGQQQLWTQLEAFARQIHGSLNPTETSYHVANEGRRLVECDRVSVGVRYGRRTVIEAVSGCDVVERRSNQVRLMRRLCDAVMKWGEKLVFTGTKDEGLPPKVLAALDAYLTESASKLLVVQPLRDEREAKSKKPPRAALIMECFEPPAEPQQHIARLDVVAKHATSALYNTVEHRRIPFRFLWMPLAKAQEGVGGPTSAIVMACAVALTLLVSILVLTPYPLKMDANGQLLPETRVYVYAPLAARVVHFDVQPNESFGEGRSLVEMYDFQELGRQMLVLRQEMKGLAGERASLESQETGPSLAAEKKQELQGKIQQKRNEYAGKQKLLEDLILRTGADRRPGEEGAFSLKAPAFTAEQGRKLFRKEWTVLNTTFPEEFTNRTMKPSEPLLRLGAKDGPWEIELKIPQKHMGPVLAAFKTRKELEVDFLLRSDPTRTFKGYLSRDRISGEALSSKEDKDEQEPVVVAYVRIDNTDVGPDRKTIDANYLLPRDMMLGGAEVHGKIRCDDCAMGYSLLYGVWEFLYERVIFYF